MAQAQYGREEEFLPEEIEQSVRHSDPMRKEVPQFLPDDARILAFTAVAALVDSGIPLGEAVTMLTDDYRANGSTVAAKSLRQFFDAVQDSGITAASLKEKAGEAFGKDFVSLEEALVLSTLPRSTNPAATLRAAAGLVAFKGSRPVSPLRRQGRR